MFLAEFFGQGLGFIIVVDYYTLFLALLDIDIDVKDGNSKVIFTYLVFCGLDLSFLWLFCGDFLFLSVNVLLIHCLGS